MKKGFIVYIGVLFGLLVSINLIERKYGFDSSVTDSKDLWSLWRDQIEKDAILVLGDSHTQLDLDLETLESEFQKEVIQLSIDGTDPWWFLKENYKKLKNKLVILAASQSMLNNFNSEGGRSYEEFYKEKFNLDRKINTWIWAWLQNEFAVFNEFLSLRSIVERTANNESWYLVTKKTRERNADYNLLDKDKIRKKKHDSLKKAFDTIVVIDEKERIARLGFVNAILQDMKDNKCKIILLNTPLDGIYDEKEKELFPRNLWWDKIGENNRSVIKIHYDDDEIFKNIKPAEFSHLDKRDKKTYTKRVCELVINAF